jgi:hypothetical protein
MELYRLLLLLHELHLRLELLLLQERCLLLCCCRCGRLLLR